MRFTALVVVFLAPLVLAQSSTAFDLPEDASSLPISHLLTLASTALSSGQSIQALTIYDHVLLRDSTDFATLYKRATVRLATGQWSKAKEGFREVLAVRDFAGARLQLAKLATKLGEFGEAKKEVELYLKMLSDKASKEYIEASELKTNIVLAESSFRHAQQALATKPPNLEACLAASTTALLHAPNNEALRLLRADCHLLSSDWDSTIGDLSRASALSPSLPPYLLLRVSLLSALFIDNGLEINSDALLSLKRCLSSDPDSKPCRGAFKALKAAEKELSKLRNWVEGGRWTEAAVIIAGSSTSAGLSSTIASLLTTYQSPLPAFPSSSSPLPPLSNLAASSPLLTHLAATLCRAYISLGQTRKATVACEAILERSPDDTWGWVGRGDKYLAEENWEESVRAYNKAFEGSGSQNREILAKLQKAQRLLKQSTAKDYYKVLGVSRDADSKAIKKAYRKATLKAHPDKEGGTQEKMAAVNEAYEVLFNPELRQRFDNGEDPNDQTAQQQNPFAQGGGFGNFFQQGGGQQFFQQGHKFNVKFG